MDDHSSTGVQIGKMEALEGLRLRVQRGNMLGACRLVSGVLQPQASRVSQLQPWGFNHGGSTMGVGLLA